MSVERLLYKGNVHRILSGNKPVRTD
uniref:Uncharacterized protein n=1 Tax=Anguilla anguilla TaxID=7936 RepID=A0A0E9RPN2_ANGAN